MFSLPTYTKNNLFVKVSYSKFRSIPFPYFGKAMSNFIHFFACFLGSRLISWCGNKFFYDTSATYYKEILFDIHRRFQTNTLIIMFKTIPKNNSIFATSI